MRITPAYAGKTHRASDKHRSNQDHPRVCGKDKVKIVTLDDLKGSPPRMRERPNTTDGLYIENRITPAYAGKTASE